MKIKNFFLDYYSKIASLLLLIILLFSPTSNAGMIFKYLLYIIIFIVNGIGLFISLKKPNDAWPLTKVLAIVVIALSLILTVDLIYRVCKIVF